MTERICVSEEVQEALAAGRPVVALETAVVTHGLPRPTNVELAEEMAGLIRACGAIPAAVAVLGGRLSVGLDGDELSQLAADEAAEKLSSRDLAWALATGATGGTTVAGTLAVCARLGIEVFATGGIGGVHPNSSETHDISADLAALARTRCCVVAAGAKAILDLPATLEHLDQLAVPVLGFGTDHFPQFYSRGDASLPVPRRLDDVAQVSAFLKAHWGALDQPTGVLLCNPIAEAAALPADEIAAAIGAAQEQARARGIAGRELTPFLLAEVARLTDGRSLAANLALLRANAKLAAQLALAWRSGQD
jgi:pseudouridylate synthase